MYTDSNILKWARWLCWTIIIVGGALFLLFLFAILHSLISPESYSHVDLSEAFDPGFGINGMRIRGDNKQITLDLAEVSVGMKIWLLIRGIIFMGVILLIARHMLKVLSSIQTLKTFYNANVTHFRRMTIYAFVGVLFSSFNFYDTPGEGAEFMFTIPFGPLAFALLLGVVTVVFKEGNRLMEDQKLFV